MHLGGGKANLHVVDALFLPLCTCTARLASGAADREQHANKVYMVMPGCYMGNRLPTATKDLDKVETSLALPLQLHSPLGQTRSSEPCRPYNSRVTHAISMHRLQSKAGLQSAPHLVLLQVVLQQSKNTSLIGIVHKIVCQPKTQWNRGFSALR